MTSAAIPAQGVARQPVAGSSSGGSVEVVETAPSGSLHLTRLGSLAWRAAPPRGVGVISVDDSVRYQRVVGFGGAMTDSAAWLIRDGLSRAARVALIDELYGPRGDHLSFTVVPMAASDFTRTGRPYSYDDMPAGLSDPTLDHFSVGHDQAYVLPVLRQAIRANPRGTVFAVPWSPPGWMKANDALDNWGESGGLRTAAYGPLAAYFVRFLQSYAAAGVPVTAVAPENEPDAPASYPSMSITAPSETQWIDSYLAPALDRAGLRTAIYGADVGWSNAAYADAIANSGAPDAISGIAWHCYGGVPPVMSALHASAPGLTQLVTECAPSLQRLPISEVLIGSLRNWASSVALWNLALDPSGGPVQPPDSGCPHCMGLVTINPTTHRTTFSSAFYELGQVSRFVSPGAWRIETNSFVGYYRRSGAGYGVTPGLDDVAFIDPDGTRVLVAYDNEHRPVRFCVAWRGRFVTVWLPARATVTLVWPPAH